MNGRKIFLAAAILFVGYIAFLMALPFLGYMIGAALLAFILKPVHNQVSRLMPQRPAAMITMLIGLAMIVIPFTWSVLVVIEDAQNIDADLEEIEAIDIEDIENRIYEYTGQSIDLDQNIRETVDRFVGATLGNFSQLVRMITDMLLGLSLMVFLLYYFLADGRKLVNWVKGVTPLSTDIQDQLYEEVEMTTWAVMKGHVFVAVVQGLLAGLGLVLTGVPNYAFWTFVMVILAFIPIIGTFMVWGPAAIYLFLVGEPVMSVLLAVYGFTVVGFSDNFLRPYAVDRGANLHPATILVGVLGGVYLFSAVGLFIGPIILGILKSTLLVFKNNYKDL